MHDLVPYILDGITIVVVTLLAIPIGVFCLEVLLAVLPGSRWKVSTRERRGKTVVLIPAHDEEQGIVATLRSAQSTLAECDEVVVVADNCTDRTAEVAREHGARVFERFDNQRRGKGYAINYGVDQLRALPPDVVIILDADCQILPLGIDRLSQAVEQTQRPVQAHNLCVAQSSAGGDPSLAALGHLFCCLIRPTGAARIGMPCPLMGTGMALLWTLIDRIRFDGDHLAEDKLLGIEMALAGHPPQFCPEVEVRSAIPSDRAAFTNQRRRWEHGHLRLALTQIPRLIWGSLRQRRLSSLWMALDIGVPPLALLVLTWLLTTALAAFSVFMGETMIPLVALAIEGAMLGTAVAAGWYWFCREQVPISVFARVPGYVARKMSLYASFLSGRGQRTWVRTARKPAHEVANHS